MGLLIHTSFDTPEGFAVSSVYCRIAQFTYDPRGNDCYTITVKSETYLTRERRLEGKRSITTPLFPELVSLEGELKDMEYLYGLLKTELISRGLTVEDVLETTPEPAVSQQSSELTL